MSKFNIIKKSRKKSEGIDEKIEYLDKECQKTGLQEVMTTSNVYQGSTKVPNQEYSAFQALDVNGYGLALSGADGNSIGGASVGLNYLGVDGVALSPPHPVTGQVHQALHTRDGLGGTEPLRPGAVIKRGFADNAPDYTMGSAMWFYYPTHDNGEGQPPGRWCNLEYGNFENNSGWGFWDTVKTGQFAGLHIFNTNTGQHPCGDPSLADKIASIDFGDNGTVGAPQTTVLTQKDLGDPGHLPIPLKDFSKQAFDWLLGQAQDFLGTIGDALKGSTDSYYKGSLTPRDSAFKKLKDFFADINPFTFNPDLEWATELALSVIANKPVVRTENDVSKSDIDKLYKNVNPDNVIIGDLNTVIADGNVYLDDKDGKIKSNHINPNLPDGNGVGQRQHSDNLIHPNLSNDIGKPKYSFTNPLASEGQGTIIYDPTTGTSRYVNFTYYNTSTTDKGSEDPLGLGDKFVNFLGVLGIDRKRDSGHTGDMTGIPKNILGMKLTDVKSNNSNLPNSFIKKMNSKVSGSLGESKNKSVSESLSEAVKLGHFDPEVLNVDINDIRKGIMPEFPKDPPPEMINGYSAKSKLAPKKVELPPFIKVTKKDLAQNHKLTDKEIQDFLDDVNKINEYIKNNPADLKYAMIRYPKHDPRLAQLNWQMDQMKAASEEYMETHFPENEKLFKKIQNKIRDNIEKSDPRRIDTSVPIVSEEDARIAKERRLSVLERYKKQVDVKPFFNKKTPEIDWKIDYLNKELAKNGIDEANTTSGIYVGTQRNPNSGYAEITGKNFNGRGLAMSGDSNLGQGNFGGASIRASDGAALSPPHPVTGERIVAYTKGSIGVGGSKIAIPGERRTPQHRMTGPIMWYWNSSYNFGGQQGRWQSLEYNAPGVHGNSPYPTYQAGWGYWGSGAFGLLLRNDGASYAGLFNTIDNFDPQDSIPDTTVLIKNDLDDPNFTPIDIAKRFIAGLLGLAGEGYDWLSDKVHEFQKKFDTYTSLLGNPLVDTFLDAVADKLGGGAAKDTVDDYTRDYIPDLIAGKKPPGSSKDNPRDMSKVFDDKTLRKWEDIFRDYQETGERIPYSYQATADTDNNIGSSFGTPDESVGDGFTDNGDGTTTWHKAFDFDGFDDVAPQTGDLAMNIGTSLYAIFSGIHSLMALPGSGKAGKTPTMHMGITFDNKTGEVIPNYVPGGGVTESLDESVKLGHFDPEVLNVDINDIRKGIMPEFPKDPPKMINGYSAKSRLAPKVVKGESFIKVTKKDLAALHILKDSEIKELLQQIDLINAYLKNNPADLVYAQERYPKHDIRLAKLNWQMDQQLQASEKYMDTHFPENQKLFSKLQDKIVRNINQTDPKNFTGHKEAPKFDQTAISEQERRKQVIIRHFNKKKNNLKESDWTPTTSPITNSTSQTFTYSARNFETGEPNTFTTSGLMGVEAQQTSVKVNYGFGETENVSPPSYNQLALAGYAKPILIRKRKPEEVNPKLDASQEFTKKNNSEVMMNARVTGELSLEQKKEFVEIYKNNLEEWNKKSEVRARENERRRKSNVSKVRSFVGKFGENLDKIKGVQTFIKIAQGGKKLIVIHQNNMFRDFSDKFNVRVYEAKEGKKISKLTGNFGRVDSSMFDNPFTNRKSSGEATIMYDNVGGEVESKTFTIKELPPIPMPKPPKFMQKNIDKGWQPSVTSSYDQEFINKMNAWFNTIPTGGANFPAKLAINLAKGNLDPVTESPGPVITNLIKQNILDNLKKGNSKSDKLGTNSYWDSKSGKGAIRYDMYKFGDSISAAKMAPVSAALGQYSIERTDNGIRIRDTYDISGGFTSPGGAAIFDPLTKLIGGKDVQSTGETLTAIAARRAAELGYDMVDADSGKTLRPVYSGEEEFNSRNYPNVGAPTIATPKGFNIKIDFTIPWDSFSPETANLLKIGGSKKVDPLQTNTDRTGFGYDTKGKLDSSGYGMDPNRDTETEARPFKSSKTKTKRKSLSLDEPIVRKKKNFKEWKEELNSLWNTDWKDNIDEGMTTSGLYKVNLPSTGSDILQDIPYGLTGDGTIDYGSLLGNTEADPNTLVNPNDEYTALTNMSGMYDAPDPNGVGQMPRTFDIGTQKFNGYVNNGGSLAFNDLVPGYKIDSHRYVTLSGTHRNGAVDDDPPGGYYPNKSVSGAVRLRFSGVGSPRFMAMKPVDTREVDTLRVTASRGEYSIRSKAVGGWSVDPRPMIYYWAGNHPDYKPTTLRTGGRPSDNKVYSRSNQNGPNNETLNKHRGTMAYRDCDGWRPIHMKPDGTLDNSVNPYIIDYERVGDNAVRLPDWARGESARYMIFQNHSGATTYSAWTLRDVQFQRKGNMTAFRRLDDPQASSFIRVGQGKGNQTAEQRRKKVRNMIKASIKYGKTKFGDGLINSTNID